MTDVSHQEPAESEAQGKDAGRQAEKEKAEEALPKLSAADFRVYNSMAEHMEYFVGRTAKCGASVGVSFLGDVRLTLAACVSRYSIIIPANRGPSSITPA